jgi:Mg2+ and Co2+ transporter CorA
MKHRVQWLDFQRPTKKDIDFLRKKFRFHEVILKELQNPSARSKVETYPATYISSITSRFTTPRNKAPGARRWTS